MHAVSLGTGATHRCLARSASRRSSRLYGCDMLTSIARESGGRSSSTPHRGVGARLLDLAAGVILAIDCVAAGTLQRHRRVGLPLRLRLALRVSVSPKLYKIVAFLTWLECYGPVLGRRPTPRVQDLANEPRALSWFWLYFASVGVASAASFLGAPLVFRDRGTRNARRHGQDMHRTRPDPHPAISAGADVARRRPHAATIASAHPATITKMRSDQ